MFNLPRALCHRICLCRQDRSERGVYRDRLRWYVRPSSRLCRPCHLCHRDLSCRRLWDYGSYLLPVWEDYEQGTYYNSYLVFHFDHLDEQEKVLRGEHDLQLENDDEGDRDGKSHGRHLAPGHRHAPLLYSACHDHLQNAKKKKGYS